MPRWQGDRMRSNIDPLPKKPNRESDFEKPVAWLLGRQLIASALSNADWSPEPAFGMGYTSQTSDTITLYWR